MTSETNPTVPVMTSNYIEVRHEFTSPANDDGDRLITDDVWYATRPTAPAYRVTDTLGEDDSVIPVLTMAWTLHKATMEGMHIFSRDDIVGLRKLLDAVELQMEQEAVEELHRSMQDTLDKENKAE